jgi:hypothetical protein
MTNKSALTRLAGLEDRADSLRADVEELLADVSEYVESKSEKWQDGAKGEQWVILQNTLERWYDFLEELTNASTAVTLD